MKGWWLTWVTASKRRSADACVCSIWSLGVQTGQRRKRMTTIEVRNRAIVQARGKANRLPGEREWSLLRRWAEQELEERFDLRAFHEAILSAGSLPLPVLGRHIEWWIYERQTIGE